MMKKKITSKSNKIMTGGSSFSYSSCNPNPDQNGNHMDSLFCGIENVFSGIGKMFTGAFHSLEDTVDLGKIMVE